MKPYSITTEHGIVVARLSESLYVPRLPVAHRTYERLLEGVEMDIPMIFPRIHALRADIVTRNRTRYPFETLQGSPRTSKSIPYPTGIHSAIRPYGIPLIRDHNTGGGLFGGEASETYGRVIDAFMVENAYQGAKAAGMIAAVAHPHAIRQILGGSWLTVSMGSRTQEVFCSICDANLIEKPCDHDFDDEAFHVVIGAKGFAFHEMSIVNVPSDPGAQIIETDTDPSGIKGYGARSKEHIYDLADPKRRNLLEGCTDDDRTTVDSIFRSLDWLMEEFAPVRKRYFLAQESARLSAEKEINVKVTNPKALLSYEQITELPDEAFGLVIVDETSLKRFRRFPMLADASEEQRAFVKAQIEAMKSLDPEQRAALLARLETATGEALQLELNKDNYTILADVLDGERAERAAWENFARTNAAEAEHTQDATDDADAAGADGASSSTDAVEDDSQAAADPDAGRSSDDADAGAADDATDENQDADADAALDAADESATRDAKDVRIAELEDALAAERASRVALMAEMIARQKLALHERVTKGKSYEELVAFYGGQSLAVLEFALEELRPTFAEGVVVTDLSQVESVDNPVGDVSTEQADNASAAESASGDDDQRSTSEAAPASDFSDLAYLYCGGGFAAATKSVESIYDLN